ncbi:MAG: chemotaxis-specific protein-glutamate methyltransferase CheB [Isosphaeraceae bacterium]|nr:chemotaxis-specific protein-glutamate methyltransferase CheB [Isosphaeraceae bacterium]
MIRVLVVEDSATARELLVRILEGDPEIRVVGEAVDGIEAVSLTRKLRPDLVTMDLHMPRLDGLAATKEIMITAPTPIVIVTGSTRAREVRDSMETLRVGALEVLVKPLGPGSPRFASEARRLVETVKAMSRVKVVRHWRATTTIKPHAERPPSGVRGRVVAVAASTGGPAALQAILCGLPPSFPLPILIAQQITPGFMPGLAAWLDSVCPFKVKVAQHGEILASGTVYLAPDDRHLGAKAETIALSDAPPDRGFRPSGTALFTSVAGSFGASTLAVILTGMGDDGVAGLRVVRRVGGRVIAQDESTSVVYGMPGAAVTAGLAHAVLPLDAIAPQLVSWL